MSDLNAIGAGVGQGLTQAMPALRAEAQDIREAPAKAISMEMAQEQLRKIKSDNDEMSRLRTKVTTDQLFSDNPQWKYNLPAFQKAGVLPAAKEYSQGDIENAIKIATTQQPIILADSAKNAYNDYDKMANDYAPAVQNAQLQWQKRLETSGPEAPDTLEALKKLNILKASQDKYIQMRLDASSKFDQAQELFIAKTFSPSSKDKIDENHLLAMAQDAEHPIIAKYAQGILAQKEEAKKKQQDEYKSPKADVKGMETGDVYKWDANKVDPVTKTKGVYVSMKNGKTQHENGDEDLGPLQLGRTPSNLIKEANLEKSAIQRLNNMAKYYRPEYVGIIQGRVANVERKLKELPPDQVKFYREFKQLNDDIMRAKEGAVIPEAMVQRLEQFMNDIKQPSKNFESQFDSLTDYVRDQAMNLDSSLAGQYITPFRKEQRDFWTNRNSLLRGVSGKQPAPTSSRVKVMSPDGKVGSIPSSQIKDALAQGYTEVR